MTVPNRTHMETPVTQVTTAIAQMSLRAGFFLFLFFSFTLKLIFDILSPRDVLKFIKHEK
jgi:hypothetical protein